MKVQAKWQIAYSNQLYKGGDTFEMNDADFENYKNDVVEVKKAKKVTSPRNKSITSKKTK